MTPDLERLHRSLAPLSALLDHLELELVDDPRWPEPSDSSYLNETDRANPDIMANVEAMSETNALIAWFGRDMDGFVGLWLGPEGRAPEHAPVVLLDTEGQYELVAANIADYLAVSMPEEDFDDTRRQLETLGFTVSASHDDIWQSVVNHREPNDHRHVRYNAARARHGLAPIPGNR